MKYTFIILSFLGALISDGTTYAQAHHLVYDGRFDFAWKYYNGSEFTDTARIYRSHKNKIFRIRSTNGTSAIEAGDRVISINEASFLGTEKERLEIYGLEEGAASRTFVFEVYRYRLDSVLKIPVTKESDISGTFPIQHVDFLVDSSGNLSLYDVLLDSVQQRFETNAEVKDMIYAAYQGNQCTWFRIKIESRLSTDRTYLLIFSGSGADTISAYYQTPVGEWVTQYAGMAFPEDLRGYVYKDWSAVKLNLNNRGICTVYVRVCTDNLANLRNSYIQSLEYVHEYDLKERTIFSFLTGMMVLIMILCILIYVITRVRSYLLFFLFVSGYTLLAVARTRYLGELDHTLAYFITRDFFYLVHILPVIFFLWFGIHYIEIGKRYTRWYKLIIATLGFMVFIAAILTLGERFYNDPGTSSELSLILKINKFTCNYLPYFVLLVPSLRRIRKRDSRGWYLFLASMFFIVLAVAQDIIYPGNTLKSLVFGLNSIEQGINIMNNFESAGIIVMFLFYAISPYRS